MSVPAEELSKATQYYIQQMSTSHGVDDYLMNVFKKIQGGLTTEQAMRSALLEVEGDEDE